jgi:hypothetical protein
MKVNGLCLIIFLIGALAPVRTLAQSQNSSDDIRELRKLVEEMRAQMSKMQAEVDQLKGAKPQASAQTGIAAPTAPPTPQEGTIEATQPPQESKLSPQIGEATAEYREFAEDPAATPRFDNLPLDPKYNGFFELPGTQTILKIGGFFKTDSIYDLKPAGNTFLFIPSSFPIPQVPGVYDTNVSIRPTRLSLDFRIPSSALGKCASTWRVTCLEPTLPLPAFAMLTPKSGTCSSAKPGRISWIRTQLLIVWTFEDQMEWSFC